MGGTATFSGQVDAAAISIPSTALNIMSAASGTITIASSFANSGTLKLGQALGTLAYNGGITTTGVLGVVTLYGTFTTANTALTLGAITLGANTTLNTNATTAAGALTVGAVTGAGSTSPWRPRQGLGRTSPPPPRAGWAPSPCKTWEARPHSAERSAPPR